MTKTTLTKEEYIQSLLKELNVDPGHKWKTVGTWAVNAIQDAQYGSVSEKDVELINALMVTIKDTPYVYYNLSFFLLDSAQAKAENNMLRVLNDNPELKEWFKGFQPPNYMFYDHPQIDKLTKLVESDGHSGASFAFCCRSVRRKLMYEN